MPDTAKVRCMHDVAGLAGGVAEVIWLGEMSHGAALDTAAKLLADTPNRSCVSVFIAVDAGRYIVESFALSGRRIEFCGHGALAAAFCIFEQHPDSRSQLFCNEWRDWGARQSAASEFNIKLVFAQPEVQSMAVPDFAAACLGKEPLAAAEAGGEGDYLILELDSEAAVVQLEPDFPAVSVATRRALIVTARAGSGIVYRYFAPQYGEPEDAATGSAAVQLAAYWQPRCPEPFEARQLSATGARVELACAGGKVELAARVGYG